MRKNIIGLIIVALFIIFDTAFFTVLASAAVLPGIQGGTGVSSTIAGNVGNCLSVASTSPFLTYTFGPCSGGTGGMTTSTPTYFGGLYYADTSSTAKTSLDMIYNATTGVVTFGTSTIPTLTFTNASSSGGITVGTLQVTGQTSLQSASGTSSGFSGNSYNLGNFSVGTTTPAYRFYAATSTPIFLINDSGQISLNATTTSMQVGSILFPADVSIHNTAGSTLSSELQLFKHSTALGQGNGVNMLFARSQGTMAAPLVVTNGNYAYSIVGLGYDGVNAYQQSTRIDSQFEGTPSSTQMAGRLVFRTTPTNSTTTLERMRIDSNGYITMGTSTPNNLLAVGTSTYILQVNATTSQVIFPNASGTRITASTGYDGSRYDIGNGSSTNISISGNSQLGTVKSGTWNGSVIGTLYGGTGTTTLPVADQWLYSNGSVYVPAKIVAGTNTTVSTSTSGGIISIAINSTASGGGGIGTSTPQILDASNVSLPDVGYAVPGRATSTATGPGNGNSYTYLDFLSTTGIDASWGPFVMTSGVFDFVFTQPSSTVTNAANLASFTMFIATSTPSSSSSDPFTFNSTACGTFNVPYPTSTQNFEVMKRVSCSGVTSTAPYFVHLVLEKSSSTGDIALKKILAY